MNPDLDSVQLIRCAYIGNWNSYWNIVDDYLEDNDENENDELTAAQQLVLALVTHTRWLLLGLDEDPQAWLDYHHAAALRTADGQQ